jgi:small subunit ribosomal protein S7
MPRRPRPTSRRQDADARYSSVAVQQFINKVMKSGKKSVAQRIVYGALAQAEGSTRRNALELFDTAIRNATPLIEVKPRRVGGATYQVPVEVRPNRRMSLATRWVIDAARKRTGKSMIEKLAGELVDAMNNAGGAVRRKEETHKMAEANKAFSHYRW